MVEARLFTIPAGSIVIASDGSEIITREDGHGVAVEINLSAPQPDPTPAGGRPLWSMVIQEMHRWMPVGSEGCLGDTIEPLLEADMRDRDAAGRAKYGVPLTAFNGRDAIVDAYQECLDGVVYTTQAVDEEVGNVDLVISARHRLLLAAMELRAAIYKRDGR